MADMTTIAARGRRADAVRSRARLVQSAVDLIAREGAGVSLESIAREAGVGSATLHRHFPTRWHLLEAIFKDRATRIARRAEELAQDGSDEALGTWFRELVEMAHHTSGLAAVIEPAPGDEASDAASCYAVIAEAGGHLLTAHITSGKIRPDLKIDDLMALAMAISLVSTDVARDRLRDLVTHGWAGPQPSS